MASNPMLGQVRIFSKSFFRVGTSWNWRYLAVEGDKLFIYKNKHVLEHTSFISLRYIVLIEDFDLSQPKSEQTAFPFSISACLAETLPIQWVFAIHEVAPPIMGPHGTTSNPPLGLQSKRDPKVYYFAAGRESDLRRWVQALTNLKENFTSRRTGREIEFPLMREPTSNPSLTIPEPIFNPTSNPPLYISSRETQQSGLSTSPRSDFIPEQSPSSSRPRVRDSYHMEDQIWVREAPSALSSTHDSAPLSSVDSWKKLLKEEQRLHFFAIVIGIKYEMLALGHMTPEILNALQAEELYQRSLRDGISPFSWRDWILSIADAENSRYTATLTSYATSTVNHNKTKYSELCSSACQQCEACLLYLWSQPSPNFPPA